MHESLDKIELYIISRVKEKREEKGVTQTALSLAIGKSTTYISDVEAKSKTAKYNIKSLNIIAIALGCSIKDFLPDEPIPEEKYNFIKEVPSKINDK